MNQNTVFGLGGYCENCDKTHDHPLNNIIEIIDTSIDEEPADDDIQPA